MNSSKKILAFILALTITATLGGCSKKSDNESPETSTAQTETIATETETNDGDPDISGQTITWLGTFDLNPAQNKERSVALSIFQDTYGGSINFIPTTEAERLNTLSQKILSGETIDMVEYVQNAYISNVYGNLYQPLDDYIDLNDDIWSDVKPLADSMAYNGNHYVIPITAKPSGILQYDKNLMVQEGLPDPYELYKSGGWTWDSFMNMMNTFITNEGSEYCYGIAGNWQTLMLSSCGSQVVTLAGTKLKNNIADANVEKAENMMLQIGSNNLCLNDGTWYGYYPTDNSALFYAMGAWSIPETNKRNPDKTIGVVPFPKADAQSNYYVNADISSYMLTTNSDKGDAVGVYLKCERLAATLDKYKSAAKQNALADGWTAEQYDAYQYISENTTYTYDFAYGMGDTMYHSDTFYSATRGIMNRITDSLSNGGATSWQELMDELSPQIDNIINGYTAG